MPIDSKHPNFQRPNEAIEASISQTIEQLTLDEKIALISGQSEPGNTLPIQRLGIPFLKCSDGPIGVHWHTPASTAYPATICLAASWNRELALRQGRSLGRDCRARGIHILLAPGFNLMRSPLCGRNFEYMGEDPVLAGTLAAQYVKGLQGEGVGATLKHMVANNQEWDRHHGSSEVDERTLREVYMRPFEIAVKEGGAACVMMGYNPVNGIHCSQHKEIIKDILKGEWGFEGIVMSDWVSTYDGIAAAIAGLDIEMPHAEAMTHKVLLPAIEKGIVTVSMIDDKVRRLLRLIHCFGWHKPEDQVDSSVPQDDASSEETSLEIAREGIVLLKNEASLLPVQPADDMRILLIGSNAKPGYLSGGGSAAATPFRRKNLLESIQKLLPMATVEHDEGVEIYPFEQFKQFSSWQQADGSPGLLAEYFPSKGESLEATYTETLAMPSNNWPNESMIGGCVSSEDFRIRLSGYLLPLRDGLHTLHLKTAFSVRIRLGDRELIAKASGDTPEGVETCSFEAKCGQPLAFELIGMHQGKWAGIELGIEQPGDRDESAKLSELEEKAKQADLVICTVGFAQSEEKEACDRPFSLSGNQNELIQRMCKANPNTVVSLFSGGPVDCEPWVDQCATLLQSWYLGQNGSQALAEIIFGFSDPRGRLPQTWNRKLVDYASTANYHAHDAERRIRYEEGVFIGYKNNHKEGIQPLFPFGYGLSYTHFAIENVHIETAPEGLPSIKATVRNTGLRAGSTVLQLYCGEQQPVLPRPEVDLHDFAKCHLAANESTELCLTLNQRMLEYFDPALSKWMSNSGKYRLRLGTSAEHICWSEDIDLEYAIFRFISP